MKQRTRGFTIVEVLIICIVIVILAAITTMAYIAYQNQARAGQATAMTNIIHSGAENYYATNGLYPLASALAGAENGKWMTDFEPANALLGTKTNEISTDDWRLAPCSTVPSGAVCTINTSTDTKHLLYLTKPAGNNSSRVFTLDSCTITLPSGSNNPPGSAFALTWRDPESSGWKVLRSDNGNVTLSGGCISAS